MENDTFWKQLSKNDIIVCDNEYISTIEKIFTRQLINFKILSYNDFIKNIFGEIEEQSKIELIKQGYNPYYVEKLIDNYFLESNLNLKDKRYDNAKIIINKNHKIDKIQSEYILKRQIYFINPNYTNNIINLILKKYPNIKVKQFYNRNLKIGKVFECKTLDEEINNLTNLITKQLLKEPNKKINIYIPNEEYLPYLMRDFDLIHLNYLIDNQASLYDLEYVKRFIDLLDLEKKYDVKIINEYLDTLDLNEDVIKLIEVINSFIKYDQEDYIYFRELLIKKLKNTKCGKDNSSTILIHTNLPKIVENEIYYMVGFNQNKIIKSLTDDDFISDNVKDKNGLKITKDKNDYLKKDFINKILSLSEIYISYNFSNHQIPSLIIDDLKNEISLIYEKPISINKTQQQYVLYQTAKFLDEFEKNQKINPLLEEIYEEKNLDEYLVYDNKFNGNLTIKNQINLSYTTIDIYNKCRYRYYLKYILNIKENDSKESILIGNYFHNLLKQIESKEKDEKEISYLTNKYLEENKLNEKSIVKYYYKKYEELLIKVLEYIKKFDLRTLYDEIYFEKEITKNIGDDLISGRIDKMFVKNEDNISKIIVIDYKTGNTVIDLPLIEHGLSLQIPFYFYLLTNNEKSKIIGGYIQKIIPSKIYDYKEGKIYEDNFKDEYKYNGLSVVEENNLSIIDSEYKENESIIAGLKLKSDGTFYKTFVDKGLSQEEISLIKLLVEKQIKQVLANIHNGNFEINPKMIDNKTTCNYCKYNSICNKKYQDYVHLKKDSELTFLRGNKNDTN